MSESSEEDTFDDNMPPMVSSSSSSSSSSSDEDMSFSNMQGRSSTFAKKAKAKAGKAKATGVGATRMLLPGFGSVRGLRGFFPPVRSRRLTPVFNITSTRPEGAAIGGLNSDEWFHDVTIDGVPLRNLVVGTRLPAMITKRSWQPLMMKMATNLSGTKSLHREPATELPVLFA